MSSCSWDCCRHSHLEYAASYSGNRRVSAHHVSLIMLGGNILLLLIKSARVHAANQKITTLACLLRKIHDRTQQHLCRRLVFAIDHLGYLSIYPWGAAAIVDISHNRISKWIELCKISSTFSDGGSGNFDLILDFISSQITSGIWKQPHDVNDLLAASGSSFVNVANEATLGLIVWQYRK